MSAPLLCPLRHTDIFALESLVSRMQYRARMERQKAVRYRSSKERAAAIAKAESLLRQCLEKDPCDGRAYVSLGRIYVMQQRYREARDLYKEGTRLTGAHITSGWRLSIMASLQLTW